MPSTEARMLFELGWVDDADAVGRRAGELCALVVPLGAGGGGLDTGAGAYDACRGAPTPESFDRCENEKVGTPPPVPPAPGRPTGADADADAARVLVPIVVFGPTHVGAAAGGGRGAGRGSSSSSSSELNRISRASLVGTRGDATGGRPGRRAAKSRSESSSSDSVKRAEVSLSSESTPMAF
jgi:hypothetical protein